jgi:hypothetical protein
MVDVLLFDGATNQSAKYQWVPPKQWDGGTITFVPYWVADNGTAAQTVIFRLSGVAVSDNNTSDAAFGTAQSSSDAFISTTVRHIGPTSAAITVAGSPADADMIDLNLDRNAASDTHAGEVALLGFVLLYTTNAGRDN